MTHCVMAIETIIVQTVPFTIQAHIYVCNSNLMKRATSLYISSQTIQLKSKMVNKSKFLLGLLLMINDNRY